MKKRLLSLVTVLVLLLSCGAPGAFATDFPMPGVPAEPMVYTSPDVNCSLGDIANISVNATVSDGGQLSFQWYSSPDGSNLGGSVIYGATSSNYAPFTNQVGTTYYYCMVTNNSVNGASSVISAPIAVTVTDAKPTITGIGVLSLPYKIQYKQGDRLDTAGLTVRVYTSNASGMTDFYDVTAGLEVSPAVLSAPVNGRQTITVRYEGKTCTFEVQVEEDREKIQMITVANRPSKFIYKVGDKLETAGLSLRVVTNKQTTEVTSGFTCSPLVLNTAGDQTITVMFQGMSTTFSVHVNAVSPSPSPTVSPFPSPSPSVSPSPAVSPSPSSQPSTSPSPDHGRDEDKGKGGNAVIQLILVIALLGLVALGAFVFYMQRKGDGQGLPFMDFFKKKLRRGDDEDDDDDDEYDGDDEPGPGSGGYQPQQRQSYEPREDYRRPYADPRSEQDYRRPYDGPRPEQDYRRPYDGPRPEQDYRRPYDGPRSEQDYRRPYDGPRSEQDYRRPYDGPRSEQDYRRPYDGPRSEQGYRSRDYEPGYPGDLDRDIDHGHDREWDRESRSRAQDPYQRSGRDYRPRDYDRDADPGNYGSRSDGRPRPPKDDIP